MPIHIMSPELASQIAAGEVVERPASVVKELVENAIDAGATDIRIETRDGGRRLVRVSDNGDGISADEIELAFSRHATSKLSTVDELSRIRRSAFAARRWPRCLRRAGDVRLPRAGRGRRRAFASTALLLERAKTGAPAARSSPSRTVPQSRRAQVPEIGRDRAPPHRRTGDALRAGVPSIRFHLTHDGRASFRQPSGSMKDVLVAVYGVETAEQMLALT
jgi:DNA mismatch repair protein MutL